MRELGSGGMRLSAGSSQGMMCVLGREGSCIHRREGDHAFIGQKGIMHSSARRGSCIHRGEGDLMRLSK